MSMQTAEEIMNKHLKECFETHNETISEKYKLYFHKAMKEYAQQESDRKLSKFKEKLLNKCKDNYGIKRNYVPLDELEELLDKLK